MTSSPPSGARAVHPFFSTNPRRHRTNNSSPPRNDADLTDLTLPQHPQPRAQSTAIRAPPHRESNHDITDLTNIPHSRTDSDLANPFPNPPRGNAYPNSANSLIPTPSLATYNLNSSSSYPTTPGQRARQRNITKNIKALAQKNQIICLQETHLNPHDKAYLRSALPHFHIFYNNNTNRSAGTLIAVQRAYATHYSITHRIHTKGRAHSVLLEPKTTAPHLLPLRIINAYLTTGTNEHFAAKRREIRSTLALDPHIHTIAAGDWNFTEREEDSTGPSTLDRDTKEVWDQFLQHFKLKEIPQPHHTFYRISAQNHKRTATSRLDRIYVSHSEADTTLFSPTAFIPPIPHPVHDYLKRHRHKNPNHISNHYRACSDHTPVSLRFYSTAPSKKRKFSIPRWLPMDQHFAEATLALWTPPSAPSSPFHTLTSFKRAICKAARAALKNPPSLAKRTTLTDITQAVALLRAVAATHPQHNKANKIAERHQLHHLYIPHDFTTSYRLISDYINDKLATAQPEPQIEDDLLPTTTATKQPNIIKPKSHLENIIDQIQPHLPSSRKRLHCLSPPDSEGQHQPTADPQKMADIIKRFWQPIWSKRKDAHSPDEISEYLHFYNKTIPAELAPQLPDLEQVEDAIQASGNSSCGPDGIPYGAYRALISTAAPIFLDVICHLGAGHLPPPEYNAGRLFIIPKSDATEVDRTRPITVNNTDNRIIAKLFTKIITPALSAIITEAQQGFIPGRQGATHIKTLNHLFYSAQNNHLSYYILFLDTAKAFDSIDHHFIFGMLNKIAAPPWVISFIRGLFHQVLVTPVLSADTDISLSISRGVKQGCPLSPLLFALCYDPLLTILEQLPNNANCAFADDLAIGSANLSSILDALPAIDTFRKFSGLGVNYRKTVIISTNPTSDDDLEAIAGATGEWTKVKIKDSAVYLGILMGRGVTTHDIYDPVLKEFKDRLTRYAPCIQSAPLHQRVIAFNVYLIPLFSYLIQFFLIPYSIVKTVNSLAHKHIVPLRGFSYPHLTAPRTDVGLKNPLRDLWATATARLATQYDLDAHEGQEQALDSEGRTHRTDDFGLLIADHITQAALEYLNEWAPRDSQERIAAQLPTDLDGSTEGLEAQRRSKVYNQLADNGWSYERLTTDKKIKSSLPNKLKRWTADPGATDNLREHWVHVRSFIPAHVIFSFLRMIHNATPTERRRTAAKVSVKKRRNRNPCFLCNAPSIGDKFIDSLEHIFGLCPVTHRARILFHSSLGLPAPTQDIIHSFLLTPHHSPLHTNATISFNFSAYSHSRTFFATLAAPIAHETAARRIARTAITDWGTTAPKRWRPSTSLLSNTLPTARGRNPHPRSHTFASARRSNTLYGNSKNRTPEQALRAKLHIEQIVNSAPSTSLIAFTDGSALRNPGPSGAGVYIYENNKTQGWSMERFAALGHGTNNIGEIWAIGMAAQIALAHAERNSHITHIIILTDSQFTINLLTNKITPKRNSIRKLSTAVKKILEHLRAHIQIRIEWVPGHANIPENEHADYLANLGSSASAKGKINASLSQGMEHNNFIPPEPEPD